MKSICVSPLGFFLGAVERRYRKQRSARVMGVRLAG